MRLFVLLLAFSVAAWSQALTEAAAAAAGGSAAGVAGKKVSEGVGTILQKVAATTAKAADDQQAKAAPASQAGQGVSKPGTPTTSTPTPTGTSKPAVVKAVKRDRSLVPPPPPPAHAVAVKVEPAPEPPPVVEVIAPPPPPPPPPEVTVDDLKTLSNGMGRLAVLKLGAPASRVSMAESGHLLEIYSYADHDHSFGIVRLDDGLVSSIEIKQ